MVERPEAHFLNGGFAMASCPKCGKPKVRRNKRAMRVCRHCGVLPSNKHLDQGGNPPPITCEPVEPQIA